MGKPVDRMFVVEVAWFVLDHLCHHLGASFWSKCRAQAKEELFKLIDS